MSPASVALYVTICCVLFLLSKMLLSFLLYKRWARKTKRRVMDNHSLAGGRLVLFRSATNTMPQSLTPKSLVALLMGLSAKDVIGAGGYGTVYRLRLDDRSALAVKRLNRSAGDDLDDDGGFQREVEAMGDIKHRNIVPLCGYYAATHCNLLLYQLMPNGSLDRALHTKGTTAKILGWAARCRIALGAARGLAYLHHDCIPHVIHRDVKPSNVLLDHRMEARLADFGLATLVAPSASHVTTLVAGTLGYLAPEYLDTGRATTKADVYSYGVLLIELLTAKRPTHESFFLLGTGTGTSSRLLTWVRDTVEEKREEHAIDEALRLDHQHQIIPTNEIRLLFSVAHSCLHSDPANRPTMAQVVNMLEQQAAASSPSPAPQHHPIHIPITSTAAAAV